jgi:DNA processing protein
MKQDIETHGLLISEYPPGVPPRKEHFPMRNRLIAGLSQSVIVVESKIPSGTISTVNYALQYGKDVFCVPARADEGSGCNRLIQQGAILIENVQDLLEYSPRLL